MMIDLYCPKCGEAMSSPDSMAGKSETCPACGNVATVPKAESPGKPAVDPTPPFTAQPAPRGDQSRGSREARGVARGLKQKKLDDAMLTLGGLVAIAIGIASGIWVHWIVGMVAFVALMVLLTFWYYRE